MTATAPAPPAVRKPWPLTAAEHAAAHHHLVTHPETLDWALRELAAIARDALNRGPA